MPRAEASYRASTSRATRGCPAGGSDTVHAPQPDRACVNRPGGGRCAATTIRRCPAARSADGASGTIDPADVRCAGTTGTGSGPPSSAGSVAGVMARAAASPVVASPMHKQVFDLRTGVCLDDPEVSLPLVRLEP